MLLVSGRQARQNIVINCKIKRPIVVLNTKHMTKLSFKHQTYNIHGTVAPKSKHDKAWHLTTKHMAKRGIMISNIKHRTKNAPNTKHMAKI